MRLVFNPFTGNFDFVEQGGGGGAATSGFFPKVILEETEILENEVLFFQGPLQIEQPLIVSGDLVNIEPTKDNGSVAFVAESRARTIRDQMSILSPLEVQGTLWVHGNLLMDDQTDRALMKNPVPSQRSYRIKPFEFAYVRNSMEINGTLWNEGTLFVE